MNFKSAFFALTFGAILTPGILYAVIAPAGCINPGTGPTEPIECGTPVNDECMAGCYRKKIDPTTYKCFVCPNDSYSTELNASMRCERCPSGKGMVCNTAADCTGAAQCVTLPPCEAGYYGICRYDKTCTRCPIGIKNVETANPFPNINYEINIVGGNVHGSTTKGSNYSVNNCRILPGQYTLDDGTVFTIPESNGTTSNVCKKANSATGEIGSGTGSIDD